MKPTHLVALLILSASFGLLSQAIAEEPAPKKIDAIKVEAVSDYVANNKNAVILDVRTPMEYDISHVPGALNINVQDKSFAQLVSELDSDKTYIVYCTKNPVGGRSMTALAKMEELGFKDLKSLEGGHVAWTNADLPMSKKDQQ